MANLNAAGIDVVCMTCMLHLYGGYRRWAAAGRVSKLHGGVFEACINHLQRSRLHMHGTKCDMWMAQMIFAPASSIGELHRGVLGVVRLLECQLRALAKVQARPGLLAAWHTLGPRHGIQDRQPHVRPPHLRQQRCQHMITMRTWLRHDAQEAIMHACCR